MLEIEGKIKAILPYFGGKRTLAPLIVRELGKHTQFFELCCGSAAVLFAKEQSQKETIIDLHGDLIHLAMTVQSDQASELYEKLQRVILCEPLLNQAREYLEAADPPELPAISVERAFWYFLASWMGRNGTAGTKRQDYQIAVRWTNSGGSPTVRWRNAVESLPWWHQRLQNVVILKRDLFAIAHKFEDSPKTAIYADPPYAAETRGDQRNGRGGTYLHEFNHTSSLLEHDDHTRLRDVLAGYKKARIVVSYYDHPRIRELYKGWTFVECGRQKNLARQNGNGTEHGEAPEVLIINGPSYSQGGLA